MIIIKSRVVKSEYNTRSRLCGEFPFNIRYLGIEVIEHIAVTYITAKWNKFNLFIINDFIFLKYQKLKKMITKCLVFNII